MLRQLPIRHKLWLSISLLLVTVTILSFSSFRGIYSFRGLAKDISARSTELPLASKLNRSVSDLRAVLLVIKPTENFPANPHNSLEELNLTLFAQLFDTAFDALTRDIDGYRRQLKINSEGHVDQTDLRYNRSEHETLQHIDHVVQQIRSIKESPSWTSDPGSVDEMNGNLELLHRYATDLPGFLQGRMRLIADGVRQRYHTWLALTWASSIAAIPLLILLGSFLYSWIFQPLRIVLHGSRRVADGHYDHRIRLNSKDEMAELANGMNEMTRNFQEIRDKLDEQVRQRTKEVVRSEQLASVGFLAAGVSHEINNPLASIALCAESLEERLHEIIQADDELPDSDHNSEIEIVRNYLRMIQDEAFRCKQITQQLLDFSRLGDVEKQTTDVVALVGDVIEMLGHIGKYKQKNIRFKPGEGVYADINPQEIKQVALNLVTNALDSLDIGGTVEVKIEQRSASVQLSVIDNGCGMSAEVQKHLFEPFFTRRRDGQGTGLGMSISYRIITDHGGTIKVESEGPGRGSTITVWLPIKTQQRLEEHNNRYKNQAA